MRIQHITTTKFVGAVAIDVELDTPVTIFAGRNGAGKTSLKQAIDAALLGHMGRVALKKEYGSAITDGSKKGSVIIETDVGTASFTLPDGKHTGLTTYLGALPYTLNPARFAAASTDDRRTFLYELTGLKATPEMVRGLLKDRKCEEKRIETVMPMLRAGFPAGVKFAEDKAREAKGAWKAVTGEQWGREKSDGWEAEVPAFDAKQHTAITKQIGDAEVVLQDANREFGALEEKHRAYATTRAAHEMNVEAARGLDRLTKKLEFDQAELLKAEQALTAAQERAGAAPREGLVHELADAVGAFSTIIADSTGVVQSSTGAVISWDSFDLSQIADSLEAYEKQHGALGAAGDVGAREQIPALTVARDTMQRSVKNDERDIAVARAAQEALKLTSDLVPVTDEALAELRGKVSEASNLLRNFRGSLDKLDTARRAAETATANTKKAAEHHEDVIAWLDIADALSPDGIPGDMLAKVLEPINQKLNDFAHFAAWAVPWIDSDMTLRAGKRPYGLLSESEQYRVDALLALTIAVLSETKLVAFDRFDVLDLPGRGDLLALLDDMATQGEIETALVFATLKKVPEGLNDTMRAHWIADGELVSADAAVAA
jgi:hypothetical protein